jgi:hypothetical protein
MPELVIVAVCHKCGSIVAAHLIGRPCERGDSKSIGRLVQDHAYSRRVEVVAGPVTVSRCKCAESK